MQHSQVLVILVALALAVLPAQGATIYVPDDQPTIQSGLDAAADGDTVAVRPGTYSGPRNRDLQFDGKSVTLRSDSGSAYTTVDCGGVTTGFDLNGFKIYYPVIEGFTVSNGYAPRGGGMQSTDTARATLRDIVFTGNTGTSSGGGAYCRGHPARATFIDCVFADNYSAHGGGLRNYGSIVKMTRCVFSGNVADYEGGGIHHGIDDIGFARLTLEDVVFEGNQAVHGGGLSTANDCACHLASVEFRGNTATETGGAVRCMKNAEPPVLEGVVFVDNAAAAGGAISAYRAHVVLVNSTFMDNSAPTGACLFCSAPPGFSCSLSVSHCILAFGVQGSAVWCDGPSHATLTCCDVFGNDGGDWTGCIAGQNGVAGNFCQDPLFCHGASPDDPMGLHADSPCAPGNNPFCGLVGARGVSCGVTSVQRSTWGRIKAMFR